MVTAKGFRSPVLPANMAAGSQKAGQGIRQMDLKTFLKTAHYWGISEDRFCENKALWKAELELGSVIPGRHNLICRTCTMSYYVLGLECQTGTFLPS